MRILKMKDQLITEIREELADIIDHVLLRKDVARIMKLVEKLANLDK